MANETPERFRSLSSRAANCFAQDLTPSGRIERIYHLLCTDPAAGASALEALDREWGSSARPEDRAALAFTLAELDANGFVEGRARAWTLLAIGWTRSSRGETAQLSDIATEALRLARGKNDQRAEADAQCLLGAVMEAQGKLEADQAAFAEDLAISRHLAERDPSNADWQRGLAVSCLSIARLEANAGKHKVALDLYEESFGIYSKLAANAPENPTWIDEKDMVQAELRRCRSGAKPNFHSLQRNL